MFRLSLRSAPQHRPHAGEQFGKRKRLDQVIVCAQLESFHAVAHTVASGEKQNRRSNPIAPELRDHFPAVSMWKHDIDDKKIKLLSARLLQPGFAVGGDIDRETGCAEPFASD